MELLVYIANCLYLASYVAQDMLRLRALTITAATCLTVYFASLPEPLIAVICWNVFFVILNAIQAGRLILSRRDWASGRSDTTHRDPVAETDKAPHRRRLLSLP
jgi:hypothetical protein